MTESSDKNSGQAAWGTPPPAPSKKSSKGSWVAAIVGLLIAGSVIGSAFGSDDGSTGSTGSIGGSTHTVTYKVEGTTTVADITYQNSAGDTAQQSDIDVPLTRESDGGKGIVLSNMHRGDFLYISAQNGKDYGSITCIIEVDGVVVKTNTSRGGYTIATCSGRL